MNDVILSGQLRNIQRSHSINGINFDKAQLLIRRPDGYEDIINLIFKSLTNKYQENDFISIHGNIRSYSYKQDNNTNRVTIYVFTYFDIPEDITTSNKVSLDGRICKINNLRNTKDGGSNIHFIIANNISTKGTRRLDSYIPCIAWNNLAKEISKYPVNTKIELTGELHSREHIKKLLNDEKEIRLAHELVVHEFKVVNDEI